MNLNRYRIEHGRYIFHTFSQGQKFNSYVWLENDGRFEKINIGTNENPIMVYATYYNSDKTIDMVEESKLAMEQTESNIMTKVQSHLDTTAKEWGYDTIYTAIGYIGDPFPEYNSEGLMFRNWRSAVWVYVNAEREKLKNGLRALPSDEELINELPLLETYKLQQGL